MIRQDVTLITKTRIDNISTPNSILWLRREYGAISELMRSVHATRYAMRIPLGSPIDEDLQVLCAHVSEEMRALYRDRALQAYMFMAHSAWQTPSAVVRRRRLWGSPLLRMELGSGMECFDEIEVKSSDGLRFAGAMAGDIESIMRCVPMVQNILPAFVIIDAGRGNAALPQWERVFESAFRLSNGTYGGEINWNRLIAELCRNGWVVVRWIVGFGEPDIIIDVFESGA